MYGIPDDSSATEEARLSVSLSSLSLSSDNSPIVVISSDISSSSESWDNKHSIMCVFTRDLLREVIKFSSKVKCSYVQSNWSVRNLWSSRGNNADPYTMYLVLITTLIIWSKAWARSLFVQFVSSHFTRLQQVVIRTKQNFSVESRWNTVIIQVHCMYNFNMHVCKQIIVYLELCFFSLLSCLPLVWDSGSWTT